MHGDVVDGEQEKLFDTGEPVRRPATPEEIEEVFRLKLFPILRKCHRGRPPKGMNWEDLQQEVRLGALVRMRAFRHGGKKTLWDFAGGCLYYALRDIQRISVREWLAEGRAPQTYSLFERDDEDVA
jgi:hypothetical protein